MHPRVAKLYLEFMLLAPDVAQNSRSSRSMLAASSASAVATEGKQLSEVLSPSSVYRSSVQKKFFASADVKPGTPEFARCLAHGRFALRQLHDLIRVKKYRAMHKRYSWMSQKNMDELVELFGEDAARGMVVGLGNKEIYGYQDVSGDDDDGLLPERGQEGH